MVDNLLKNKQHWEEQAEKWDTKDVYTSQSKGKLALKQPLW